MMEHQAVIRYGWLRGMYIWTIFTAGFFGMSFLFAPVMVQTMMGYPTQETSLIGISASVYLAFVPVSVPGFFSLL